VSHNSLETFETVVGPPLSLRTISSLGHHIQSLSKLVLKNLSHKAVARLSTLAAPKALRTLVLMSDAFKDNEIEPANPAIASWLCQCECLRHLELCHFHPILLSRVLQDDRIHLETLQLLCNDLHNYQPFFDALPFQAASLRALYFHFHTYASPYGEESLGQALYKMSELRELDLESYCEEFLPGDLETLSLHLTKLERFKITGLAFDAIPWSSFQRFKSLRYLCMNKTFVIYDHPSIHGSSPDGVTCLDNASKFFTVDILRFVAKLGPTNKGFHLQVFGGSDPDDSISPEAQYIINNLLGQNVGGTFDYEPAQRMLITASFVFNRTWKSAWILKNANYSSGLRSG
jgi:hypothetical protein